MWIFHPSGFCSVVEDASKPGNLLVRGRMREDLERLFPLRAKDIAETPRSDYRFRVSIPREEVARCVGEMLATIDYGNFKDACPDDRHGPYLDIWTVMYRMQLDRLPRPKRRRRKRGKAVDIASFEYDLDHWYGRQPRDAYLSYSDLYDRGSHGQE